MVPGNQPRVLLSTIQALGHEISTPPALQHGGHPFMRMVNDLVHKNVIEQLVATLKDAPFPNKLDRVLEIGSKFA